MTFSERYDLRPGRNWTLATKYGSVANVQAALKDFHAWARSLGLSDTTIMQVDEFSASWNNEVWRTHGYYPGSGWSAGARCNSRANIDASDLHGLWHLRMPLLVCMGRYTFASSSFWSDSVGFSYGQRFTVDSVWVGIPGWPKRCVISTTYGQGVNGDYTQGLHILGGCFIGPGGLGAHDPHTEAGGILLENGGSTARLERVVCDDWNGPGIHIIGAIPLQLSHVRAFRNNRAGVLLEGTALGTVFGEIEGDDNVNLVETIAGRNAQAAGLKTGTFVLKSEQGKRSQRGQCLMYLRGQFNVNVTSCSSSVYAGTPDCAFRWDTTNINSRLMVGAFANDTPGTFAHLVRTNSATYRMPAQAEGIGLVVKGGTFWSDMR